MSNQSENKSVRPFIMSLGIVLASLGGGAALLTDGQLGYVVGGVAFFLVLMALFFTVFRHRNKPNSGVRAEAPMARFDGLLNIEVGPYGRIRALSGQTDLFPGLKIGQIADEVLLDSEGNALTAGQHILPSNKGALVIIAARAKSNLYIVIDDAELLGGEDARLQDRTTFFAGLGHDLKSPLNAVIGFSDIMDAEIKGPLPEGYRDYPGLIKESAETLLRLVEDMLDFAKSEAGAYEIDKSIMDVAASGEAVMRQSQAVAERAGVTLRFKGNNEVLADADPRAVQRIWDNLVSNAIKYSSRGGVVEIGAYLDGQSAILSVSDQGAGMNEADLESIATPFAQGVNSRGRAGTGLGLAMVKRLAEMHDGQVTIRTAIGQGTEVVVRLPVNVSELDRAAE